MSSPITYTVGQRVRLVASTAVGGHSVGTEGTVVEVDDDDPDLPYLIEGMLRTELLELWHPAEDLEAVDEQTPQSTACVPECQARRELETLRTRLRNVIGVSSPSERVDLNCDKLRRLLEDDQS